MSYRVAICLLLFLLFAPPSFAWWETGHRTVARLAAARLTRKARGRVAALLGVRNTAGSVADAMAAASTWPDETKNQTQTGEWHYIDLALQDKPSDIRERCPENNCITGRIVLFANQLATGDPGKIDQPDALRYLIHLVADIHQPLHAISDADLGGNCEQIEPFMEAKNLHALWDGGIVNAINPSGRALAKSLTGYINLLSNSQRDEWSKGNAADWTWESHLLAKRVIYERLHIPVEPVTFPKGCAAAPLEIREFRTVTDGLYINDMKPIVRDQLAKAGLRLAALLNQTFQ